MLNTPSPLDAQIVELYCVQLQSLSQIGREIGVCRETVAKRLRRLEIPIRRTGPRNGYRQSDEHRARISEALTGRQLTPAHLANMSKSMTGRMAKDKHWKWNGGVKRHFDGYIYIRRDGHHRANGQGYVMEHILVMEEMLDRPLSADEQVHHINGVKDDNRPENLMLFRDARDHQMWHQFFKRRAKVAK